MVDSETVKNLESLHRLKAEGIINEADFEKAKSDLLNGLQHPKPAATPRAKSIATTTAADLPGQDQYLEWALQPLKRYADFNGRSCRREFWMFQLLIALISAAAFILVAIGRPEYPWEHSVFSDAVIGLWVLGLVGVLIPYLAVQVRRFHDQDKSGWFALFNIIPYIGTIVVLVFMVIEGTRGDNQFGPDPLERGS